MLTDDVEHVPGGKTFFWAGRYHRDINHRDTLQTDLNVFEDFQPKLSPRLARLPTSLFLGNIQPDLQREVREQCRPRKFVAMDSMNLWIDIAHEALLRDDRARRLPGAQRLRAQAAHRRAEPRPRRAQGARRSGPRVVIAKQGEYGSAMITRDGYFGLTAVPDGRRSSSRRAPATRSPAA